MVILPSFITSVLFGDNASPETGTRANEPLTEKTTVRGDVKQAGLESYAFSGMQGWRMTMEDAHMVCTSIPVDGREEPLRKGHAIFGVMDGHGGDFTSEYASANFMNMFSASNRLKKYSAMSTEEQSNVPGLGLLRHALSETFSRLDIEIRKQQNLRNEKKFLELSKHLETSPDHPARVRYERSGSTCIVVLVTPSHIICANAGDSRAILRRDGKPLPLSFDHKPNNAPELERIHTAKGFVKSKRVDGDLAVSRGLGDFTYKSSEVLRVDQQKVIPNPEFVMYPRKEEDEFIILACDGIWDVANNEQCGSFVQSLLDEGETDLGLICEEAIDTCLDKNSRDNMTIAMVTFEGCKMPSGGLGINNIIWQRRTARQARQLQQSAKKAATRAASNVGLISEGASPRKRSSASLSTKLASCS
jgi:serine/threonine protein phosphatase PrpC